jgi:hypothetical protein
MCPVLVSCVFFYILQENFCYRTLYWGAHGYAFVWVVNCISEAKIVLCHYISQGVDYLFSFQDTIYHPNQSIAMGSSISGTMAEISDATNLQKVFGYDIMASLQYS